MAVRIRRNTMIADIVGRYMQEQGFELRTDKWSFWEWSKEVLGVVENVVICDKHNYLQLLFGNDIGNCSYVMGNELLHTIDRPRTQCEQWSYSGYEGNLKELYTNILYDMHDIIVKNWQEILEEQAAEYKKEVPNRKHFEIYVENYEQLAQEALKRYEVEGQSVLKVYDVVMSQIQKLQGKELEKVENDLLKLAAMWEKTIWDAYGGERFVNSDIGVVVLSEIGKTRKVFNILKLVFLVWKNPPYFEDYKKDFLYWYNREEAFGK